VNPARASYSDIHDWRGGGLLDNLLPFIGNSMAAGWNLIPEGTDWTRFGRPSYPKDLKSQTREAAESAKREGDQLRYVVWSYSTIVAMYYPETGESEVSENYWGQTTGRHIGACRRALPRVRSNDPSALDGIGPGSWVREVSAPGPAVGPRRGTVIETHPLAGAIRVRFDGWPSPKVIDRDRLVLA